MLGLAANGVKPVNGHLLVKLLPQAEAKQQSGIIINKSSASDVDQMLVLQGCDQYKNGDHVWVVANDKAGKHRWLRTLADDEFFVRARSIVGWKKAD